MRTKLPEPTVDERIAELERVARDLTTNNVIVKENFAALRDAFNVDLPAKLKGQDDATRAAIVQMDSAIATLHEHCTGLHALIDSLAVRMERLEALMGSRKAGTVN